MGPDKLLQTGRPVLRLGDPLCRQVDEHRVGRWARARSGLPPIARVSRRVDDGHRHDIETRPSPDTKPAADRPGVLRSLVEEAVQVGGRGVGLEHGNQHERGRP